MPAPNQLWITLVVLDLDVVTFVVQPTSCAYMGRDPAVNDLILHDTKVSRVHARLSAEGDGFVLQDLDSASGTTLNGARIEREVALKSGDTIGIASYTLRVELRPWRRHPEHEAGSESTGADPTDLG
ncbi:MAG: FHA domain-containing protein [Myxococcota bacterium]|jgi:pSer/pThr/pTyr-binding forkhead associated (FHA) protein|nr:FHA domain-containing protein [Myxococcota bacterium]